MEDLRNYRISLKFSEKDSDHVTVAKLLKQMGRKKSSFIVKAVKYYLENNPMPEIPGNNPVVMNMVTESIIKATILKMLHSGEIPSLPMQVTEKGVDEKKEDKSPDKESDTRQIIVTEPSEEDYFGDNENNPITEKNKQDEKAVNDMLDMLSEL